MVVAYIDASHNILANLKAYFHIFFFTILYIFVLKFSSVLILVSSAHLVACFIIMLRQSRMVVSISSLI